MARNVAVAIGIGKTKGFTALPGAQQGAADFIKWARSQKLEKYETKLFSDRRSPVKLEAIADYIQTLCNGTVSKLLLFFSGHGVSTFLTQDYWILSEPRSSEIVDLRASLDNARAASRIPYIAVFADACRSQAANGLMQATHNAGTIFPSPAGGEVSVDTKIDVFFATKSWKAALEANPAASEQDLDKALAGANGFFTEVLLEALAGARREALAVNRATGDVVVSPRKLELVLKKELPLLTGEKAGISQVPDSRVESAEPHHVALVRPSEKALLSFEARLPDGSVAANASIRLLQVFDLLDMPVLASSTSGRVERELTEGLFYGVDVTLDGYLQLPAMPHPLVQLSKDYEVPVAVALSPAPRRVRRTRGGGGDTKDVAPVLTPARPASLTDSYAIDAAGNIHANAPGAGVYTVVTQDLLSGRTESELVVLAAGQTPAPAAPIAADPLAEGRLDSEVASQFAARQLRDRFETAMGFAVRDAAVLRATSAGAVEVEGPIPEGEHVFWHVRCYEPGAVVLEIEGGRHIALPSLPGFIGAIEVDRGGVRSLAYAPTSNSRLYQGEEDVAYVRVRALAEAAVRAGRLDLLASEAQPFAAALRQFKHVDPVLGVLAAYAYHQAGNMADIDSILAAFQDVNEFVPFDVAMLAGRIDDPGLRVLPGFPLLTEGWRLLAADPELPVVLAEARRHLAPSLWTTVLGQAGADLAAAVAGGGAQTPAPTPELPAAAVGGGHRTERTDKVNLVFIHGRGQAGKDAVFSRDQWVAGLKRGFERAGVQPADLGQVMYPFYGDVLQDLVEKLPGNAKRALSKGVESTAEADEFERAIVERMAELAGVDRDAAVADLPAIEKGPDRWGAVHRLLRAIESKVPWMGEVAIGEELEDVKAYISNAFIQARVNEVILPALRAGPCVVVSHSLGTVVAYIILANHPELQPAFFITAGSPLGIQTIKDKLPIPLAIPAGRWLNISDKRDIVALYPSLDRGSFVDGIENLIDIDNSDEPHSIANYLSDARVGRLLAEALS